jgi:orotate phosphoribosyltransferase
MQAAARYNADFPLQSMITPRERLRSLIEQRCLITDANFKLSTGQSSSFYFDCKAITLIGEGLSLIADQLLEEVETFPEAPTAIGGLTLGADFITSAVILRAFEMGKPLVYGSIVRKEPKKHGTRNKIENQLSAGTRIVVIDDVITTGSSTRKACEEFLQAGYKIVGILAVVDREAGGKESLERDFGSVRALFKKGDFPSLVQNEQHDSKRAVA